jgi:hypothetical protein
MPKLPRMPGLPGGGAASLPDLEYRRLAGLAVGILVVILVLVLLARSCSGSSAKSSNEDYVNTLTQTVLKPSDAVANDFHDTLDLRSASLGQLQGRINNELKGMRRVRSTAAALKPTKQLEPYQAALLQALQLRVTGLTCLSQNLPIAWRTSHAVASGQHLYQCMGQLLSSDYVYADFYADGANSALKKLGAAGVPTSLFMRTSDLDLLTPAGIGGALKALHPGAAKGLHGTQVVSVIAEPAHKTLEPGPRNQLVGNDQLEFVATIKNSGNFTEVGVNVKMTLKAANGKGQKFTQTKQIQRIAKGASQSVSFTGLFASSQDSPQYSDPYTLTITSEKVPGEKNLSNNTSSYTVFFTIQ